MTYAVYANPGRKPWIFATLGEARASANHIHKVSGRIVAIETSDKPATHTYTE